MQCSGTFSGQFIIAGEVDAELVAVHIADGQASFTSENKRTMLRRQRLYLRPFNRFVLFTQDARALSVESVLELSGTNVGALVDGPLGHPADNENDFRPVVKARITTTHSRSGLRAVIDGTATEQSQLATMRETFRVWFEVPLHSYQAFFCVNQEIQQHVEHLYAERFGAA